MERISAFFTIFGKHKYLITATLGVLFVVFIGQNSLLRSMELQYEISDLKKEIEQYNKVYENDKQQLRDLERDPRNIERIARERYFMKTDDEDIFVLSTDPRTVNVLPTNNDDETTD